ncbi:MAG: cytochrome c biogenesis protein CcsA [Chloroflexi bacterium]|nr:cytochrome c biogenesis protein CcsA [Chloroflexota bacterium]
MNSRSEARVLRDVSARSAWLVINAALMAVSLWMIFLWVPTEANLGVIQRALYFHVPVSIIALGAIILVAIGSVAFLVSGRPRWDWLAHASAETGVLFGGLALVTGSIWARPIWNVWWTWDAKLTTTLILWFIFIGYLMLRAYAPPGRQGARLSAVVGIIGAIDAPIIYYAADLWRTAHPSRVTGPGASGSLESEMALTLLVSTITIVSLYAYVLVERFRVRRSEAEVAELSKELQASGIPARRSDGGAPATATGGD